MAQKARTHGFEVIHGSGAHRPLWMGAPKAEDAYTNADSFRATADLVLSLSFYLTDRKSITRQLVSTRRALNLDYEAWRSIHGVEPDPAYMESAYAETLRVADSMMKQNGFTLDQRREFRIAAQKIVYEYRNRLNTEKPWHPSRHGTLITTNGVPVPTKPLPKWFFD